MGGELLENEVKTIPSMYTNVFVESGTYKGDTSVLASKYFNKVITIEIHEPLYKQSKKRFEELSCQNIEAILGNTLDVLKDKEIYEKYKEGGVFYLDGHISGHDSSYFNEHPVPLLEELKIITSNNLNASLIIIDDVRLWGHGDWKDVTKENVLNCFPANSIRCAYTKNDRYWIYTSPIERT